MFPGIIGVDFAHEIDSAMEKLKQCDRLILDLRGNPGGGIGGLRLMSYLVPDKRPVGYSLTRKRAESGYRKEELPTLNGIPDGKWKLPLLALKFIGRDMSIVTVTEGRGPQRFHSRIVVLSEWAHFGCLRDGCRIRPRKRTRESSWHQDRWAPASGKRLQGWPRLRSDDSGRRVLELAR